jgi:hypothetical protein
MTFSEEKPFTEYIDITFIIKLATTEKGEKENSRIVKRAQLMRADKSLFTHQRLLVHMYLAIATVRPLKI